MPAPEMVADRLSRGRLLIRLFCAARTSSSQCTPLLKEAGDLGGDWSGVEVRLCEAYDPYDPMGESPYRTSAGVSGITGPSDMTTGFS